MGDEGEALKCLLPAGGQWLCFIWKGNVIFCSCSKSAMLW